MCRPPAVSVKSTLLAPLTLARTLMLGVLSIETEPLDAKVAMSSPVSALTTVKLFTVCAETHIGADIKVPHKIVLHEFEMFTFSSL